MKYEIEFCPVGEASKPGDAIVIKYEGENGGFYLIVIDGGNLESGQAVVRHIRHHYGTNAIVAHAILTHSDTDHACGFREIVKELSVRNIWMHLPWLAAPEALPYFANKSFTAAGLVKTIRSQYELIDEISSIAAERQIPISQPFAGERIGPFTILSPWKWVYELLLPQFDKTPDADQTAIEAQSAAVWVGKPPIAFQNGAKRDKLVKETWESERLREGGITSATNESSVVLYGDFGAGERVLLTGDAGHLGLLIAKTCAAKLGLPMREFSFVQIPHHGSRSNVGPAILNTIVGPILPQGIPAKFAAFVSAPKDDNSHPRRMVLNSFLRRGAKVFATQGSYICHTVGYPFKSNYTPIVSRPFSSDVEDYD